MGHASLIGVPQNTGHPTLIQPLPNCSGNGMKHHGNPSGSPLGDSTERGDGDGIIDFSGSESRPVCPSVHVASRLLGPRNEIWCLPGCQANCLEQFQNLEEEFVKFFLASMALLGLRGPHVVDAAAGCCHHSSAKRICTGLPRSAAHLRPHQLSHQTPSASSFCHHRRARSSLSVSAAAHSVQAG